MLADKPPGAGQQEGGDKPEEEGKAEYSKEEAANPETSGEALWTAAPADGTEAYHEEGKAVSRCTAAAPETLQSLPIDKLRPPMLTLAREGVEAAKVSMEEGFLGLMVESALGLHGLGQLTKVQKVLPPTPARNLKLDQPRCPPWEISDKDFSSEAESDIRD